jgi:hypothetical protein
MAVSPRFSIVQVSFSSIPQYTSRTISKLDQNTFCLYGLFDEPAYCSSNAQNARRAPLLGFRRNHQPAGTNQEEFMKKALMLLVLGASLASCTATEKGAGIGAASGAIIGGAVTGNVRGAAVGAAIGGVSGAVIGNVSEQPGQCYYRDRYGRRYIDDCPRRY